MPGRRIVVIGVDPGPTTGIAVLDWTPGDRVHIAAMLQTPATEAVTCATTLLHLIPREAARWLAIEGFTIGRVSRASRGHGRVTRDLIGALGALPVDRCATRVAAQVKPWATDQRITALGAARRGMPHAIDAARHALYMLVHDGGCPDPLSTRWRKAQP